MNGIQPNADKGNIFLMSDRKSTPKESSRMQPRCFNGHSGLRPMAGTRTSGIIPDNHIFQADRQSDNVCGPPEPAAAVPCQNPTKNMSRYPST